MPSLRQALYNILKSRRFLDQFSEQEQERILQNYRDSIGLTQNLTFGAEALKAHADKRLQNSSGFTTKVGPNEEDTFAKLIQGDNPPEKQEVRTAFENLLKPKEFYTDAQETYKDSMEFFKKRINQIPELTVDKTRGYLEQINQRGRKAIEAQQKKELEDFKAALDSTLPGALSEKIKKALGKTTEEVETIKKDLIAEMEKKHAEQLSAFNDSAKENLTILDKASALENKRVIFSGMLESWQDQLSASDRDRMDKEMERAREENRKKRGITLPERNTTAYVDFENQTISAIDPNDLDFIISLSGSEIKQQKGTKEGEPGIWTVEMSSRIFSPFYYLSNKENPKVDMLTMAQAVRASGFDSITMTINFDDKKTLKDRAKQAYEAALEAGFDPAPLPGQEKVDEKERKKGIHLIDKSTGKEIDPRDIFSAKELQMLHEKAAQRRQKLSELVKEEPKKEPPEVTTRQFREEIDKGRIQAKMTGKTKEEIEAEEQKISRKEAEREQEIQGILGH
ncbi:MULTISPECIES: hypothetical protein [Legionella]|uniref:Coiled coil domain-containing protein n=1 Tax=Legionella resiliens TaxID=2905958 RepID=A0ABS8X6P7_9GAMM|nr:MULTISPECIES: hypothetical protein [unclassified Legionella]MCE0723316.1 hypothetical protein [Legionella sp. 9fVS26]MCE3532469.1 hypothetical protein [Legionella sp. 8cVS16]QLZ68609.1 hypothetical protein FOLKNPGA_01388 [Legionella sp. PC1000]